jgi:hypothetical protein
MSQAIFDTIVPSTTSGNQLAAILNDFKNAVVSGYTGTARPSQLQAGGYWIDTTNDPTGIWKFKVYDGTKDIVVFTLNKNTGLASISSADSLFEIIKASDDSLGPVARLLKKRIAGLGQTASGDTVGEIQFQGTRDDGVTTLQARMRSVSQNNVTAAQQGAYISFDISPLNGASIQEVMRLVNGRVAIGTTSPDNALHVVGNGARLERIADDAIGPKLNIKKKRIAGAGQVLNNDEIGSLDFKAIDSLGAEVNVANVEVKARENITSGNQGSRVSIKNKKLGQSAYTEQIVIEDDVFIPELRVNKLTATQTEMGTIVESQDASIVLNKNGTKAGADSAKAGFEIEMSDNTNARIGYDSTKTSRFVIGEVGSEKEIVDVSSVQTITNKIVKSPTRAGVKEGTEAALITYAATADNGQWCFATDTKVMYQIIDGELVPAGSGGGGSSLVWEKSGTISPITEYVDGLHLENFGNQDVQEMYCFITVPNGYRPGKPISLSTGAFFLNSTAGKVRFRTETTLIKAGTTVLGSYPNKHTSTNAQADAPTVANTLKAIGTLDLTSTTGLINGVAVAKGDMLRVRIYRDFASESVQATVEAKLLINNFELRLS